MILVCGCDRTDERIVLCPEHDAMAAETVFGAVPFYGCRGGKVPQTHLEPLDPKSGLVAHTC